MFSTKEVDATIVTARTRLLPNIAVSVLTYVAEIGAMMLLVPYFIGHLGVTGYGMVPLSHSFANYIVLLTAVVSNSVGRYVMIYLERRRYEEANEYLTTGFRAMGLIWAALAPLIVALTLAVPYILDIPPGEGTSVRLLFLAMFGSSFLTTIAEVFYVSTFCRHRFDLRSLVRVLALGSRLGVIILLFRMFRPSIWHAGGGYLSTGLVTVAGAYILMRYLTPELSLRRNKLDRAKMREIVWTSKWLLASQIGAVLYLNTDLIVINKTLGVEAVGYYSVLLQFFIVLRTLGLVASDVFAPIAVAHCAHGDYQRLTDMTSRAIKFIGVGMAVPVGLLCGLAGPILNWWVGEEFLKLAPLTWLMLGPLVVNLAVVPLSSIYLATNDLKLPGIVTLIGGVANTLMSVTLVLATGLGLYGVALASAICLSAKNLLFAPIYAASILRSSAFEFLRPLVPAGLMFGAVSITTHMVSKFVQPASLAMIAAIASVIAGLSILSLYLFVLNKRDRQTLWSIIASAWGRTA